jgi:hypothetical protein
MNIPTKAKPLVDSICNAYRLKGLNIANKRFQQLAKDLQYYEQIMLAGYVKHHLNL